MPHALQLQSDRVGQLIEDDKSLNGQTSLKNKYKSTLRQFTAYSVPLRDLSGRPGANFRQLVMTFPLPVIFRQKALAN